MSAILLDGAIVHYEVLGRGRPIIFLHSWVGSWRYWISSMQVASTAFRAYALDLWGFGDTARQMERYSLDGQVSLLQHFLEALGIGRIAMVAHGLGALVGLAFAARNPQSVDRILAVNCPLDHSALNARLRNASPLELLDWLGSRKPEAAAALADAPKADAQAIAASLDSLRANNFVGQMRALNIPCLLVYGQNDPAVALPAQDSASLPLMIHRIDLDESGHFPMLDESPKFHRLLTDFLALESGISPRELQLKEEWKRRVR